MRDMHGIIRGETLTVIFDGGPEDGVIKQINGGIPESFALLHYEGRLLLYGGIVPNDLIPGIVGIYEGEETEEGTVVMRYRDV